MLVVGDVAESSRTSIDRGASRSGGHVLQMAGMKQGNLLRAVTTIALNVESGLTLEGRQWTDNEVWNWLCDHPSCEVAVARGDRFSRECGLPPSLVAYSVYRFMQIDDDDAMTFWTSACDLVGLERGSPILAMHKFFADRTKRGVKMSRAETLTVVFTAWNAWRRGEARNRYRVRSSHPLPGLV